MRNDWPASRDAIARYQDTRRVDEIRGWLTRGSPGSELLATRDAAAYAEWLCSHPPVRPWPIRDPESGPPGRGGLRGLVLRGGRGSTGFPDNPWGVPPGADLELEAVIRRLWASVADRVPTFVDRLVERVFALAMVRHDGHDYLAYLMAAWVTRDVRDVGTASIEELMDARELTVGEVWGGAPLPTADQGSVAVLGEALPAPLGAVAAVHRFLTMFEDEVYIDLENLQEYERGLPNDGDYAVFAEHRDRFFVLDLGVRDQSGMPTVVWGDPNDGLIPGSREALWPFLDRQLREMLDPD